MDHTHTHTHRLRLKATRYGRLPFTVQAWNNDDIPTGVQGRHTVFHRVHSTASNFVSLPTVTHVSPSLRPFHHPLQQTNVPIRPCIRLESNSEASLRCHAGRIRFSARLIGRIGRTSSGIVRIYYGLIIIVRGILCEGPELARFDAGICCDPRPDARVW